MMRLTPMAISVQPPLSRMLDILRAEIARVRQQRFASPSSGNASIYPASAQAAACRLGLRHIDRHHNMLPAATAACAL